MRSLFNELRLATLAAALACVGRGQEVDFDCRGEWGAWSECSAPCGGGTRERVYIVRIAAVAGGRQCAANDGDIERDSPADCAAPCPVDCAGGWGDWSACSRNCGGGVRHRSYEIDVPAAGGGDRSSCLFADAAHAEGGCNTEPCGEAVDCIGSWGPGAPATRPAAAGCGAAPTPSSGHAANGGGLADCVSSADRTEERACNTEPCPADCVGSWGEWLGCEHVCEAHPSAGTMRERVYTVSSAAANGGRQCAASDDAVQRELCDRGHCPSDCIGSWGAWSACSASCAPGGSRQRVYSVTTPARHRRRRGHLRSCGRRDRSRAGLQQRHPLPGGLRRELGAWSDCRHLRPGPPEPAVQRHRPRRPRRRPETCDFPDGEGSESRACENQPCPVDCVGSGAIRRPAQRRAARPPDQDLHRRGRRSTQPRPKHAEGSPINAGG